MPVTYNTLNSPLCYQLFQQGLLHNCATELYGTTNWSASVGCVSTKRMCAVLDCLQQHQSDNLRPAHKAHVGEHLVTQRRRNIDDANQIL